MILWIAVNDACCDADSDKRPDAQGLEDDIVDLVEGVDEDDSDDNM